MMESNIFCLTNPFWWLQLHSSNFSVSLAWFLNCFCVKFLISRLPKVQQTTIKEFLQKTLVEESTNFFVEYNFLESVRFCWNGFFMVFFLNLEFWIFKPQLGNFWEKILQRRSLILVWNKSFIIGWTHNHLTLSIVLIFSNYYFINNVYPQ